jgi:hypothetical protein
MDVMARGNSFNFLQYAILNYFRDAALSILSVMHEDQTAQVLSFAEEEGVRLIWKVMESDLKGEVLISWPEALSLFMGSGKANSLISLLEVSGR